MRVNVGKPSGRDFGKLVVNENVLIVGEKLGRFDYHFPDYGVFLAVNGLDTVDRIKTEADRRAFFQDRVETYVRTDSVDNFLKRLGVPNYYFPRVEYVEVKTWRDRKEPKPKKIEYKVRGCLVVEHKLLEQDLFGESLEGNVLFNVNIRNQNGLGRIRLYLPDEKVIIVGEITALKRVVAKRLGLKIYTEETYSV